MKITRSSAVAKTIQQPHYDVYESEMFEKTRSDRCSPASQQTSTYCIHKCYSLLVSTIW